MASVTLAPGQVLTIPVGEIDASGTSRTTLPSTEVLSAGSSNTAIATAAMGTMPGNGLNLPGGGPALVVTGVAAGSCTITVSDTIGSTSATLSVTVGARTLTLNPSAAVISGP